MEAVTGTLRDLQQQWELEQQELGAALGAAEAVREQLEGLLQQEREQGQQIAEQLRNEVSSLANSGTHGSCLPRGAGP